MTHKGQGSFQYGYVPYLATTLKDMTINGKTGTKSLSDIPNTFYSRTANGCKGGTLRLLSDYKWTTTGRVWKNKSDFLNASLFKTYGQNTSYDNLLLPEHQWRCLCSLNLGVVNKNAPQWGFYRIESKDYDGDYYFASTQGWCYWCSPDENGAFTKNVTLYPICTVPISNLNLNSDNTLNVK